MTKVEIFQQALSGCQKLGQQLRDNPLLRSAQTQLQYLIDLEQGKRQDWGRLNDISLGLITVREIEGVDDALANWVYDQVMPAVKEMQQSSSFGGQPAANAQEPLGKSNDLLSSRTVALQTVALEDYIETLHFTPDGKTLVSALTHNDVMLWRVSEKHMKQQFSFPSGLKRLYDIALSPDGTRLATAGLAAKGQEALHLWDLFRGKREKGYSFLDSYLLSVAFSPDQARLLAAGSQEELHVVNLTTDEVEFALTNDDQEEEDFWGLGERNTSIVYHPDDKTVLITACSQAGSGVVFCELDQAGLIPRPDLTLELVYDVLTPAAFSPDGRFFAFADWNVKLYSFPDRKSLGIFSPEGQRLGEPSDNPVVRRSWSNVLFTPDSRTLICGSPDGGIFLWDVPSGTLRQTLTGHDGGVLALALDPTGTRLASSGHDKTLRLWQMPSGNR